MQSPSDDRTPIYLARAERVSVFDFTFDSVNVEVLRRCWSQTRADLEPWGDYNRAFEWIFYGIGHESHERHDSTPRPRLKTTGLRRLSTLFGAKSGSANASATVMASLNGFPNTERYIVPASEKSSDEVSFRGKSILVDTERRVGVAAYWLSLAPPSDGRLSVGDVIALKKYDLADVVAAKQPNTTDLGPVSHDDKPTDFEVMKADLEKELWFAGINSERQYALIATEIATPSTLRELLHEGSYQTYELGRLFTGGDEHETLDDLASHITEKTNLSRRFYERLFVRWTDVLAVYESRPGPDLIDDYDAEYHRAFARIVHIVEMCVLARRMLRNVAFEIDDIVPRLKVRRPDIVWRSRGRVLRPFADIERDYKIAPRYKSVEGERLTKLVFARIGNNELLAATRTMYELLERRLSVVESHHVLIAGVAAFVATQVVAALT
jgi:hypothetical protein